VEAIPVVASNDEFAREFARLLQSVVSDVQLELGVTISETVASLVAADIAVLIVQQVGTAIAAQLGVDAGILGAGAGASWATLGVSVVAAIVADIALDWLIKVAGYDPAEKVSATVQNALDRLRGLLVDGDSQSAELYRIVKEIEASDPWPDLRRKAQGAAAAMESSGRLGLRHDLLRLNKVRARLRSEALKRLVLRDESL
jgi:hypothetical protein